MCSFVLVGVKKMFEFLSFDLVVIPQGPRRGRAKPTPHLNQTAPGTFIILPLSFYLIIFTVMVAASLLFFCIFSSFFKVAVFPGSLKGKVSINSHLVSGCMRAFVCVRCVWRNVGSNDNFPPDNEKT